MKVFVFLFALVAACTAFAVASKDEPQCQAPGGGGLQAVLKEFVDMIPLDKILGIYLEASATDPEVQAVMAYLESEEFKKIVETIRQQPEFEHLLKFTCDNLYLDLYYYLNVIGGIIGLPPIERPKAAHPLGRPGLVGMLHDMIDVLPVEELKAMFEKKLAEDKYLQLAMETIRSEEFRHLVDVLKGLPEFKDLISRLRGMGVDVDALVAALRKFFDW